MVVIGIIVVLAGLGISAFNTSGGSLAISTAASQVSTVVAGARQLAVSSNARTRFVILADSTQNEPEWRMRSYAILKEEPGVKVGTEPLFTMVSHMEQLPAGIYFAPFTEELNVPFTDGDLFDPEQLRTQPIQTKTEAEYAYIEFLPTGGTTTPTGRNVFMMLRGSAPGQPLPNADDNKVGIGVAQMTGRVKVERFSKEK